MDKLSRFFYWPLIVNYKYHPHFVNSLLPHSFNAYDLIFKMYAYNIMYKNGLARGLYQQWPHYYKVKSQRMVELGIVHIIYLSWKGAN